MLRKAKGFTLVELLVVVSIIALLMAMLVPALGRARQAARNAAMKSALNAISTGLEQFRGEYGHYPSSKRVQGTAAEIVAGEQAALSGITPTDNGAHHLAAALVGLDMQGYDETGAYDPCGPGSVRTMFLDVEKIGIVNLRIEKSRIDAIPLVDWKVETASAAFAKHELGVDNDDVRFNLNPMLVDNISSPAMSRPILYWRANRRGRMIADVYNQDDNADILDDTNAAGVFKHPDMSRALAPGGPASYLPPTGSTAGTFEYHVWNPATSASAASVPPQPYGKPYNADSFLLICAGADGEYGTKDDISNFEQLPKPE